MRVHKPYMQKSFQPNHDKGVSGDYTDKYSKLMKAADRSGKIFAVSYITLSLLGKITTSHLAFTKANFEIEPTMKNIKETREIANAGTLLRYETDNVNGDALL